MRYISDLFVPERKQTPLSVRTVPPSFSASKLAPRRTWLYVNRTTQLSKALYIDPSCFMSSHILDSKDLPLKSHWSTFPLFGIFSQDFVGLSIFNSANFVGPSVPQLAQTSRLTFSSLHPQPSFLPQQTSLDSRIVSITPNPEHNSLEVIQSFHATTSKPDGAENRVLALYKTFSVLLIIAVLWKLLYEDELQYNSQFPPHKPTLTDEQ